MRETKNFQVSVSQTKNRREKILISGYEIAEKGLKLRLQAT